MTRNQVYAKEEKQKHPHWGRKGLKITAEMFSANFKRNNP